MQARLMQLASGLPEIVGNAMMENKSEIIGLVIGQHEIDHVDSNNEPLRRYSHQYALAKELYGMSGETTLDLTGQFHGEMNLRVDVAAGEFEINSPAQTAQGELKSEWLTKWNGSEIMGLTPDSKEITNEIVTPIIIGLAREMLQV
jgi:hypothetical protein